MSEIPKALSEVLKIYAETDEPVTQHFYQGLCLQAIEQIEQLRTDLKAKDKEIGGYQKVCGNDHKELSTIFKLCKGNHDKHDCCLDAVNARIAQLVGAVKLAQAYYENDEYFNMAKTFEQVLEDDK